eukprot:GFUD01085407.1.p1 GENE.GFUD01085407.1~~GFUD01085407.1.p1  ORF type:complete len:199 (+),score=77.51 GFUD01085407.1:44-640(+)
MEVSSKLARQMAYKKRLEEEYRLAEERRKSWKISKYSGYQVSLLGTEDWGREENSRQNSYRGAIDTEEDRQREMDILKQKKQVEEEEKEEVYQKEKEKWIKKRAAYIARAAKFSELKKKRLDEKKIIDKSKKKILEDEDIWAELENILKENEIALKDLENYKRIVEISEKEEEIKPAWGWRPRSEYGLLGSCNRQLGR